MFESSVRMMNAGKLRRSRVTHSSWFSVTGVESKKEVAFAPCSVRLLLYSIYQFGKGARNIYCKSPSPAGGYRRQCRGSGRFPLTKLRASIHARYPIHFSLTHQASIASIRSSGNDSNTDVVSSYPKPKVMGRMLMPY